MGCRNWQPCPEHQGWINANTEPLPTNWNAVKRQARAVFGPSCRMCGRTDRPQELDHIIPRRWGGTNDLTNLQWLCKIPCHKAKSREDKIKYKP